MLHNSTLITFLQISLLSNSQYKLESHCCLWRAKNYLHTFLMKHFLNPLLMFLCSICITKSFQYSTFGLIRMSMLNERRSENLHKYK